MFAVNMMFNVIFYLTAGIFVFVASINLTSFKKYKILFDPQCQEYFLFNGPDDYAYFYRKNGKYELWLTQNTSNYAIYASENSSTLLFEWHDSFVSINQQPMNLVLADGVIQYPMKFQSEVFMCDIIGIVGGEVGQLFLNEELACDCDLTSYKCEHHQRLLFICTLTLFAGVLLFLILYTQNESLKTLLGSTLSWFIQRYRQILSGSEENLSQCDEEECSTSSSESASIQFA